MTININIYKCDVVFDREATDELKDLEAEKRKTYTAQCVCETHDLSQQQLDKLANMKVCAHNSHIIIL